VNVLMVGSGSGGSWQIRGVQLGRALGARVTSSPTSTDFAWADVIVLVKHAIETWGQQAKQARARVVWDVLDVWAQPDDNGLLVHSMTVRVAEERTRVGVDLLIGATELMATQIRGAFVPHHARPGLSAPPVRPILTTVAYEGQRKYLGLWAKALDAACARIGCAFVVNPPSLAGADLIVAFRGGHWDGALCRDWKSGVKLVNALAVGRPVLTQPSAAFSEKHPPGAQIESPSALEAAIRAWQPLEVRQQAYTTAQKQASAYTIDTVAAGYRARLERVWRQAA
jgi:hypothetical protein